MATRKTSTSSEAPAEETVEEIPMEEKEGYNPDAKDGDGDGKVQDGTEFERPVEEPTPEPEPAPEPVVEAPKKAAPKEEKKVEAPKQSDSGASTSDKKWVDKATDSKGTQIRQVWTV